MFTTTKLSEQKGARKYGQCISCGKGTDEDPDMILIQFNHKLSTSSSSIVLCQECAMRVADGLAERKDRGKWNG